MFKEIVVIVHTREVYTMTEEDIKEFGTVQAAIDSGEFLPHTEEFISADVVKVT